MACEFCSMGGVLQGVGYLFYILALMIGGLLGGLLSWAWQFVYRKNKHHEKE